MNTVTTWQTTTTDSSATSSLGQALGRKLQGGEVIKLISDLGGGKTTFVKGLAAGIGSLDLVRSPSFTIANQYKGQKLRLYHLDLYRLELSGIIEKELSEFINEPNSVTVIEWPGLLENLLPSEHLTINIIAKSELERRIEFLYPRSLNYLFPINP